MLLFLNGSVGGCFLKKYFSLLLLSKLLRVSDSFDDDLSLLGTKVRPKERTSSCGELSFLEERLVMFVQ